MLTDTNVIAILYGIEKKLLKFDLDTEIKDGVVYNKGQAVGIATAKELGIMKSCRFLREVVEEDIFC